MKTTDTNSKKPPLLKELIENDMYWNFWKKDWSKYIRIQWNGKTPFSTVRKIAIKNLGIKSNELIYERSISLLIGSCKPDLIID